MADSIQKIIEEMRLCAQFESDKNLQGGLRMWADRISALQGEPVKLADTKELNDLLLQSDPSWDAWKRTIPEKYWARYDRMGCGDGVADRIRELFSDPAAKPGKE